MSKVKAFEKFLETREKVNGITTYEGHVVIPEEVKDAIDINEEVFSFRDLITVSKVNKEIGVQPVLNHTNDVLQPVEQLGMTPPLPIKPFTPVKYEIKTKRGYTVLSQELVDDAESAVNDVKKHVNRIVTNTENNDVLEVLNTITVTEVASKDELRNLLTGFTNTEQIKFYVTQEAYNELDKADLIKQSTKYENGSVFGKELVNIEGEGNQMYIGNLKEVILFDRSATTMEYEVYQHYGTSINIATRHDVQLLKNSSIKKVSFKVG